MKEWFISGSVHLVVGFLLGWLVFKRPDIMTRAINWLLSLIGLSRD
jgi:hypothetical protein